MTGQQMAQEMAEQPGCLWALVQHTGRLVSVSGGPVPSRCSVTIVAHGSSDHAATYGRYLLVGITNDTTSELAEVAGAVIELGGEEHAVPATKTVTTQAPVLPAALGEDAGRHGAAIAAWPGAGIDEAELAAWEA